jgi:mono/diheme cytochrome c family protein
MSVAMTRRTAKLTAARMLVALGCALAAWCAVAADPVLTIEIGGKVATHTVGSLLSHPATVSITVPADVSYKRSMTYRAIPMATLLGGIAPNASVRFLATDGFAAVMQADVLLASDDKGARAYLAIEPPDATWPPLRVGDPASAGPFYLVWLRPERAMIVPEQWPYRIARVDETASVAKRFPSIVPASTVAVDGSVNRGYAAFVKNCLVCHTLNLAGDASVGPDLNVPFNPTEYMRLDALRRLIRDPQSLRRWPGAKMPGIDAALMSDRELNDMLAYLRYMANRKVAIPPGK